MLSMSHILLVIVIVLILFGAGKLPSVMEDLAKGVRSFKKAMNEDDAPQAKQIEDTTKKDV